MATKALTVNVQQLEAFADRLGDVADTTLGERSVTALNEVVDRTYDLARSRINAGINLTDDYVRRKVKVVHATIGRPTAEIVAAGDRSANTPLRNYEAKMLLAPSQKPRSRQGPRRTAVPFGMKQTGVQVEVTRGGKKRIDGGFMLPLRAGTVFAGNGLGVFTRSKSGQLRHRYGPAVYQLFRFQIEKTSFIDEIENDLEGALVEYAEAELQKAVK